MRSLSHWLAASLLLVAIPSGVIADTRAFVGAKIIPIDGDPIENGVLVVVDNSIGAIGSRDEVSIPDAPRSWSSIRTR